MRVERWVRVVQRTGWWAGRSVVAPAAALVVGLVAAGAGCNSGSSTSLGLQGQGQVVDAAALQSGGLLALLAGQAALSQTSTFTLPADTYLCNGADIAVAGNSTAGTVTVTLPPGGCTSNFGAVYGGSYTTTYSRTGNVVTATTTFSGVEVTSVADQPLTLDGTLTLNVTVQATAAAGTLAGTLTLTDGGFTRTLVVDFTQVQFDDTVEQMLVTAGTVDLDDPLLGRWDVTLAQVVIDLDPLTPCVTEGTIEAEKAGIPVQLDFDPAPGCNEGILFVNGINVGTFSW